MVLKTFETIKNCGTEDLTVNIVNVIVFLDTHRSHLDKLPFKNGAVPFTAAAHAACMRNLLSHQHSLFIDPTRHYYYSAEF